MLKIALCDDEPVTLDLLKNEIDALLQAQNLEYQIASYASGLSLLQDFSAKGFDVLFLDIDMPDVSGFQVAEALQDSTSQCRVVFVTSKRNLMHQSFDYQPFHFICKGDSSDPFPDLKRILSKLLRFYRQNYLLQVHDAIRGVFVLSIKDIYYIKAPATTCTITKKVPPGSHCGSVAKFEKKPGNFPSMILSAFTSSIWSICIIFFTLIM